MKKLFIQTGIYTEITLEIITTNIVTKSGNINSLKFTSILLRINHINIKTKEFAINAKNSQNLCM